MKRLAVALALLVAIGSTAAASFAAQTDAWLEGYAAAVLEREGLTAPSLVVRHVRMRVQQFFLKVRQGLIV